jgi:ferritin-like protein
MASNTYHEPLDLLTSDTRDMHRAITSLMEELEAIDWYQQRADACVDAELRDVLLHNKNEEIEHAAMLMEWIRRHGPRFDAKMRTYLFQTAPIVDLEKSTTGAASSTPSETLGVGSMKED